MISSEGSSTSSTASRSEIEDRKTTILTIVAGAGLVLTIVVFLLGRRSGKKKTTYVEIRRV